MLLSCCGHTLVERPYDPVLPEQGVTCPLLAAGARRSGSVVVKCSVIFPSSLPTAPLLVAVLISFLIEDEQTSHFPWTGFR